MKLLPIRLGFLVTLLPLTAVAQTTIPATTYSPGQPVVVAGLSTITTGSNAVTVTGGATVIYQASTTIRLEPGFHASLGASFYATIGSTLDSDNDGLPDVWARAHGVGAGGAQNPTSNGLTYLLEYKLGTNPSTFKQIDTSNSTQLKINRPTQ